MRKNKIDIISLGCSKNLVDSEHLMRQFEAAGYQVTHNAGRVDGETVVVNTCGFIADAQQESIDTILQLGEAKRQGKIRNLVVMGCLSERFRADLIDALPEVDRFYGKFDWKNLIADLGHAYRDDLANERHLTTPDHYCYLKISEGCNRFCAFCAIPLITGRHTSVPMPQLLDEVQRLAANGVKEFNVIAQDLSSYGMDLEGRMMLPELIERMADIDGVEWIRLHYAYPTQFPYDILPVMASRDNVCSYLDIALQHISDTVLTNMRRHITRQETLDLLARLRREVPGIHIRTTLMVGFPGEGEQEFNELMDFVRKARFERMGAFAYSEENGTWAAKVNGTAGADFTRHPGAESRTDISRDRGSRGRRVLCGAHAMGQPRSGSRSTHQQGQASYHRAIHAGPHRAGTALRTHRFLPLIRLFLSTHFFTVDCLDS